MIVRIVADQRLQAVRGATAANKRRQPRQRIGVETIEGRICGRSLKIKRLLA